MREVILHDKSGVFWVNLNELVINEVLNETLSIRRWQQSNRDH